MNIKELRALENRLSLYQTKFDIALVIMDALNLWRIYSLSCFDNIDDFLWQDYDIHVLDNLHVKCPEQFASHLDFYFRFHFDFDITIDCI